MIAWQACPACGGVFAVWDAAYPTAASPELRAMSSRMYVNREGVHHIGMSAAVGETRCIDCGVSINELGLLIRHTPIDSTAFWRCAAALPPPPTR